MTVTRKAPEISERGPGDARWALVERIAASRHLKSSARLREFLFYTADCALRDAPEEATEQQIGIRVFQRNPGYNSSEDSIVRTHARLLRQKLTAYFEEHHQEELVVEIPKGHYLPVFHAREAAPAPEAEIAPAARAGLQPVAHTEPKRHRFWDWKLLLLLIPIAAVVMLVAWQASNRTALARSPVDRFWQPFLSEEAPLVIYSNALFTGDSRTGLRYAEKQTKTEDSNASENLVDTYTGIGELASVYTLTQLFDAHHSRFILKRSALTTWDEAKSKNLVFIGSIAENLSLRVLQSTTEFSMTTGPGFSGLINNHPRKGEPTLYSRPERPLTKDYAILALVPGVQPDKRMLIFSGLTTFGTQAAVDFVCHPESLDQLMPQITGSHGEIRPFEAVLETNIGGGVPLQTKLVTLRVH